MKKITTFIFLLMLTMQASAQNMKDIIRNMPDSITPLLTKNNRLDFIDYLDAAQKAEEKNRLGGTSEMTKLTATRAVIRMSKSSTWDFKLLNASAEPTLGIITTVQSDSTTFTSIIRYYNLDWQLIKTVIPEGFERCEWNDDSDEISKTEYHPLALKQE